MLQQVHLVLQFFRVIICGVVFPDINGARAMGGDVVEVSDEQYERWSADMHGNSYFLSALSTIVVLSLKCTPTLPSVKA